MFICCEKNINSKTKLVALGHVSNSLGTINPVRRFAQAARSVGAGPARIMLRHIVPQVAAVLIVSITFQVGVAIIAEAALSFLGLGAGPEEPSWGGMLRDASQGVVGVGPWLAVFPGVAIAIVVFSWNVLGDSLRDVLDPRLRGSR